MTNEPIPLNESKSVHCITEYQMQEALRIAEKDQVSSGKIQNIIKKLEADLSRNELAALSFVIIKRLKETVEIRSDH